MTISEYGVDGGTTLAQKIEILGENPSQHHFVVHKSHIK
jgi:hypothetical protein